MEWFNILGIVVIAWMGAFSLIVLFMMAAARPIRVARPESGKVQADDAR